MIEIVEVKKKRQLRAFVDFPNKLYRETPEFVPATYADDMGDWNRKKNPAFDYCDAKAFLAYKDKKLVGRIGAIYSRASNEKWNKNRLRFTQLDFIDDPEVSSALFGKVEEWAKELGCSEVHGPLGFCDLDREGMLIEGFDRRSLFYTYYNHPYYIDHLEKLGYIKDVDWIETRIKVPENDNPRIVMMHKLGERALKRYNLKVVKLPSYFKYAPYIEKLFRLVNVTYADLYGTVDLNERQIKKYARKFAPLVSPKLQCLVEDEKGDLVGFAVACPSIERVLQKSRGRIFPFAWIGILRAFKKNDQMNMLLMAVRPDYSGTGLNALMLTKVLDGCHELGIKYAETGPMLEENTQIRSQWEMLDKEDHKRRRCWKKEI